jgi:hypothetical protein
MDLDQRGPIAKELKIPLSKCSTSTKKVGTKCKHTRGLSNSVTEEK